MWLLHLACLQVFPLPGAFRAYPDPAFSLFPPAEGPEYLYSARWQLDWHFRGGL
jgi:hypothetical protein